MLSKSDISQKTSAMKQKIKDDHERFLYLKFGAAMKDANNYQSLCVLNRLLEQNKMDICKTTIYGRNLLTMASELGYSETVRLLVQKKGMNPNVIDNNGNSPLSIAKSKDVVEMLYM